MASKSLKPCNFEKFSHWAKDIVKPAYQGVNGGKLGAYHTTYTKYFTVNFFNWLDNMWRVYSTMNCEMFKDRFHYLNQELEKPHIENGDGYHKAIVEAKIHWNRKMNEECGCTEQVFSPIQGAEAPAVTPPPPPKPPPTPTPTPVPTPPPPTTPSPQVVQTNINTTSYGSGGGSGGSSGGGY